MSEDAYATAAIPVSVPATGVCARCEHHTNDGLAIIIDQGTRAGGLVLHCADRLLCDKRRAAAARPR